MNGFCTENRPRRKEHLEALDATTMSTLDRIQITFDDHRLVNNAGLLLPATLALNL